MRRERRQRGLETGVLLLLAELCHVGGNSIPPVTLVTIIGQALLYTGVIDLPWSTYDICISANKVWNRRDFKPLLWSNFVHADDMHLYYNMISYLVKGRTLESKYGSANFAGVLCFLTFLTSGMYVALSILFSHLMDDTSLLNTCAVGFSGVIFALKFITTVERPYGHSHIAGFNVPTKYAAWAELIAIHLLVPNASFIGHLAGIVAGALYIKTPLRPLVDSFISLFTGRKIYHNNSRYFYN